VDSALIRELKVDDADDIWRILTSITKPTTVIDYVQLIRKQVQQSHPASFVVEIEEKVVGFMVCNIIACGFGLLEKSAWIVMLGVSPEYWGQGIGKLLAEKICQICKEKGIDKIYSSVSMDSVDLLSFFKALQFERSNFITLEKKL